MNDNRYPLKLLVAEDDDEDYKLLHELLENISIWKFDITRIKEYDEVAKQLSFNVGALCFCNTVLGHRNCIDLLDNSNRQTPVILLSPGNDYRTQLLGIKAGAFDFLVKEGLTKEKLELSISAAIERINQLKKLKGSERKFKNIFQRSYNLQFITDDQHNIQHINNAVKVMLGYDEESCKGSSLLSFFQHAADAATFKSTLSTDGEIKQLEAPLLTLKGTAKLCSLSACVETGDHNSNYTQGTISDLTDLKKIEKVNIHSEKHAASGRFITTLAHELRNPLNNIKLAVENLLPAVTNEDDVFFLNIIHRNGERINDMVTELLNSSRPVDVDCRELSLHNLLNQVIYNLRSSLTERNIILTTHFDMGDAIIKADPIKLSTALGNIIQNAMEAVKDNTGLIELTTFYHNNQLTLIIKDNGTGISDEHKDQIFEPYFTSKRNGIGLGLSSALNILQSHQANTEVNSTEAEGTSFTIRFSTD